VLSDNGTKWPIPDSSNGKISKKIDFLFGREKMSVERSEVESKVIAIIVEQLGIEEGEVKLESNFIDDLGADSLDTVELVMAFEEEFDLEIPDEEAEKITTVGSAIDHIVEAIN